MSRPYWVELADLTLSETADRIREDFERTRANIEDILWEPEGQPPGKFRVEVLFKISDSPSKLP